MSTLGNFLLLVLFVVGGIAALNVISPDGNMIFEVNQQISEMFSITTNVFAEIDWNAFQNF